MVRRKVFKLKSARGQALLASLLLLLILGGMSTVAVWRVQSDRAVRRTLESRATAVAALNDARAGFFLNINLLVAGILGGDPAPFVEEYSQRRLLAAESIAAARAELTALNETEEIATLDTIGDSIEEMQQEMDAGLSAALIVDRATMIQMAGEYERKLWPRFETIMADTDKLAKGEQAELAADRAAADGASDASLRLLIGLGVAAFLVASAILAMFILSLLRPLASLQASARAITSGNWEARAKVSGPEETASLARDFNEMTEILVERSAQLEESEGRFRNVLDVSRDFIYKLNVETGTYDYVSPSVLRLTGFTPEEFIAMELKGVAERAHPEDKTLLNMPFRMLLELSSEDSSVARVEYRWKHKDGEYLWVSDSRSLIRDENGRAIALVGTVRDETKRKQAEAALRESEEQLRNVLDVSRDLIYRLNLQTRTYEYVSPSVRRLVGFAPQEIVAMGLEGVRERFHPEDRERLGTHPSRLPDDTVEGREAPTIEYRWQCKDGEYRWLSDNRAFVLDEDGRALALVGTVRDVTERRQAEEELRKSEEKHRILFETIAQGVVYQSADGAIISANPAAERILGLTIDQMQGRTSIDPRWKATHKDGSDFPGETHPSMAALKTGRKVLNVVMGVFNPKDASHRWININAIPVFRPGENKPYQVYTTFEDITERQQAEEALRESEERFRSLSASAPIGIFLMDKKGRIIYTNERLQAISGSPPQGGPSEELATAVHPDDLERVLAEWAKAEEEPAEFSQEYRILTPQGETRWVRMHVCPIFSADGRQSGVVGTIEDITAPKQAEEAMANRLKMESAVASTSNLLARPEDADAGLDLALRILGEAFGADRAHIFLLRDNNTRMANTSEWCAPGVEPQIDNLQDLDCAAIPWWMGKLAQNDPIIMTDASAAPPDAVAAKKSWKALNIRSLLAVPLLSDGKPIGYVRFTNMKSDSTEREEDIRLLRLASESIASFIERQRAGEEKRKAYESVVFLLATAAEARDPYTEHHLQRIRGFTEAIAAEMGLPPDEIREIGLSSLLHDLGKMRVPDSILTKPGPLSAAEWKIMKQHPLWGEELLSAHPWLETARQIARWHHERWDGTGYPDGLRAEQIPLGAAIVAVADSLDAMISDRPYKKAWPPRQAIVEIRTQKGRQYSPNVVEAFNRALRKGAIKRVAAETLRLSELDRAA